MDFRKEKQPSSASAGADQLCRAHLDDASCRSLDYRVCQTNTLLHEILILSQNPHRKEQVPFLSRQLNQGKIVTIQQHSIRSLLLPGHDRVALHTKASKSAFIISLRLFATSLIAIWNTAKQLQFLETRNYVVLAE